MGKNIIMKNTHPAHALEDLQFFGEFGGVNPSIEDSSTYTFMKADQMAELFEKEKEGCYLYSRHWNPTTAYLSKALARMEFTEAAIATASGMAAITCTILQLCKPGDEIICSRMIYGGTYAFLKNIASKLGINTIFVDMRDLDSVAKLITPNTKLIYTESMSNPLLEISDIPALSALSKKHNLTLVVDNTFSPLLISPALLGADIVIHSLTKFINGTSDTIGGIICGKKEFIAQLSDVNSGTVMLLGPVLDSIRAASILKNLHSLPIRMEQHSRNALYLATALEKQGEQVFYPGLASHPQHQLLSDIKNEDFGFGGIVVLDMGTQARANQLMELMQDNNVGYLAVSLGFYKTLFSAPGSSTSSEIEESERMAMGLSNGLVRISVGLNYSAEDLTNKILDCLKQVKA